MIDAYAKALVNELLSQKVKLPGYVRVKVGNREFTIRVTEEIVKSFNERTAGMGHDVWNFAPGDVCGSCGGTGRK